MTETGKVTIDLEELNELRITPTQYILAYHIHHQLKDEFNKLMQLYKIDCFNEDMHNLIIKGYLNGGNPKNTYDINFDKSTIIGIFIEEEEETGDVLTWSQFVKAFRDIFPAGIKSGGFYVRSSERDLSIKLKKFVKDYGYSQDTILDATQCYIDESGLKGYAYIKLAVYFILKNNESMLASACGAIEDGGDTGGLSNMFADNL